MNRIPCFMMVLSAVMLGACLQYHLYYTAGVNLLSYALWSYIFLTDKRL